MNVKRLLGFKWKAVKAQRSNFILVAQYTTQVAVMLVAKITYSQTNFTTHAAMTVAAHEMLTDHTLSTTDTLFDLRWFGS